jgi:hypothetical protein
MTRKAVKLTVAGALAALMVPAAAQAQWWQSHPHYLHAMSDLRVAYWLVNHRESFDPMANAEERHAAAEIRAAYHELKEASITDGKDIDDQPPADMNFGDHKGRLHHAMDLLHEAHNDVTGEEEDPAARGLRGRALGHIDAAAQATHDAMVAWRFF